MHAVLTEYPPVGKMSALNDHFYVDHNNKVKCLSCIQQRGGLELYIFLNFIQEDRTGGLRVYGCTFIWVFVFLQTRSPESDSPQPPPPLLFLRLHFSLLHLLLRLRRFFLFYDFSSSSCWSCRLLVPGIHINVNFIRF